MQRGFSLVEILVAMGASTILLLIAMTVYFYAFGSQMALETTGEINQNGLILLEYLSQQFQNAGGSSLPAYDAVWVEDASSAGSNCPARSGMPACSQADRVTISTANTAYPTCTVQSQSALGTLTVATNPGTCCLNVTLPLSFSGQSAMLVTSNAFANIYITSVNTATCQITYIDGQAAGNNSPALPPAGPSYWTNASLVVVNTSTFYVTPDPPTVPTPGNPSDQTNTLHVFSDLNGDGAMQANEDQILADQFYDFQVALGFDFNPTDGIVSDGTMYSAAGVLLPSEFLYSSPGQALGAGVFATANLTQMVMVKFAFTLGVPIAGTAALRPLPAQALDGSILSNTTYPGIFLQPVVSQVAFRNIPIFQ